MHEHQTAGVEVVVMDDKKLNQDIITGGIDPGENALESIPTTSKKVTIAPMMMVSSMPSPCHKLLYPSTNTLNLT